MALKAKFNSCLEWGKNYSPEILLVTGLIEGVVGTVLACRATLKSREVLEKETENKKEKVAKSIDICKVYAVPAALMVVSGTSICAGHGILRNRYTGVLTAYSGLTAAFMEYRGRVREEIGAEKEESIYYGTKKEVISTKIKQKDGKEKTVNKKLDVRKANGLSPYAQKWDPIKAVETDNPYYVDQHIARVKRNLDDQLKANGHLYLNDARRELILELDDVGQIVGWIYDPHKFKDGNSDGFVEIIKKDIFVKNDDGGYDHEIWIDFNVDGVIFGKMSPEEYNEGINELGDQGLLFSNKED